MDYESYRSEIEKKNEKSLNTPLESKGFEVGSGGRVRSSLRMRYQAEVQLIRKDLGGLEDIRNGLGISQRKICQLLLVDPSAWTRWLKDESKVPPHVFRALSWYVDLKSDEKSYGNWPKWTPVKSRKVSETVILKSLLFLNLILTSWLIAYLIF